MRYLAATAVMLFAAQFASARGEPPNAAAPVPGEAPDLPAAGRAEPEAQPLEAAGGQAVVPVNILVAPEDRRRLRQLQ